MAEPHDYLTCSQFWGVSFEELVIVEDASGKELGSFPIDFLVSGAADTLTVEYLVRVCKLILEIPPSFEVKLSDHGRMLKDTDSLVPGVYQLNGVFKARRSIREDEFEAISRV